MEEITEKVPNYKIVEDGIKEVKKYKASNGTIFDTKEKAIECEVALNRQRIYKNIERRSFNLDLPNLEEEWYFISNQEELDYIKGLFDYHNSYTHIFGEVEIGEWVSCVYIDGGDYCHDRRQIFTLTYLKENLKEFFDMFEGQR